MQTYPTITSAWQQLKNQEVSCTQALSLLVDAQGNVNTALLDRDVSSRFWRHFPDKSSLPPTIPLLLWQGCYYLGSPVTLTPIAIKNLSDHTGSTIKIIPITEKSYCAWFHTQKQNNNRNLLSASLMSKFIEKHEQENIIETTEINLSKAADQIDRIKTLLSGALHNRASDIHLEPMPEGLRVRYRIDGVLRDITTLPADLSRRVIVALKVMCNTKSGV